MEYGFTFLFVIITVASNCFFLLNCLYFSKGTVWVVLLSFKRVCGKTLPIAEDDEHEGAFWEKHLGCDSGVPVQPSDM